MRWQIYVCDVTDAGTISVSFLKGVTSMYEEFCVHRVNLCRIVTLHYYHPNTPLETTAEPDYDNLRTFP
jgi:hypothetical protein